MVQKGRTTRNKAKARKQLHRGMAGQKQFDHIICNRIRVLSFFLPDSPLPASKVLPDYNRPPPPSHAPRAYSPSKLAWDTHAPRGSFI